MKEYKDNRVFFLNTTGISAVEFFWGLGLPLVLESTFLQLFLAKLGASNIVISLIPTVFFVGQAFLGVVSAYSSRNLEKQRSIVLFYHLIPSIAILLFGIYLHFVGSFVSSTIIIFFIAYIIFNAGIGLLLPVWQNYVVKIFSPEKVIPALAIMMIAQSAGRLISSFFIAGFFSNRTIDASTSSTLFILCGMLFFVGSFAFMLTREPALNNDDKHSESGFLIFITDSFKNILRNRNLRLFLLSDIDMYAVIVMISFYANYAVNQHNISAAAAAGLFVGLNYAGQISTNFLIGTLNIFSFKNKCIFGRICSVSGIILIILASNLGTFLFASVLLGVSRAIRSLIYAPAIKMLSGKSDATNYFAAAPILLLPLSTGIPLVCGKMLDSLPLTALGAYRFVFIFLGLLSFLSIFFIRRVDFSGGGRT